MLGPHLAWALLLSESVGGLVSTWKLMGTWPSHLPFGLQVSAATALSCFLGFKLILSALKRNPVWLCVSGKHVTAGNGQGRGVKPKLSSGAAGICHLCLEGVVLCILQLTFPDLE